MQFLKFLLIYSFFGCSFSFAAGADPFKDAMEALQQGEYETSYDLLLSAVKKKPKNLTYLKLAATLAIQLENYEDAVELLEKQKTLIERKSKPTHPQPIENKLLLATAYSLNEDNENANLIYNELITLGGAEFTERNPLMQDIWEQYSLHLREQKEFEQSNVYLDKILADKINRNRDIHYEVAQLYYRYGLNLYELGKVDAAIESFEKQLSSYLGYYTNMRLAIDKNPNSFFTVGNTYLGPEWFAKTENERAIEHFEFVEPIAEKTLGSQHIYVAVLKKNHAKARSLNGENKAALELAQQSHNIALNLLGGSHQYTQELSGYVTQLNASSF